MSRNSKVKTIVANYMGTHVHGHIVSSRVKYGGKLQHTVELVHPVQFAWRSGPTNVVLITDDKIVREY